ncbi:MAG: hypothetical protein DRO94_01170 [Candidatus Altiarchaeales archaeon]|nr:MAG: hypothetical protein DRO95_04995 [Candidatus Altiarchaeales archaeon]RLI95178.1 MAG: hypothetical protein DRO94_01170 [Candidatus Altiarchaeales archaeon]
MKLKARTINSGTASGIALVSKEPLSFFGMIDPETGKIIERGHELEGESIKDRILVFPYGKGSTVGSYVLYRLKKNNLAPRGIINSECEPIIAIGAIISDIPCVDKVDISRIKTNDKVTIDNDLVVINE